MAPSFPSRPSARPCWVAAGIGAFFAAGLAEGWSVRPGPVFWGMIGFVAFVLCVGRAIALWRVDEMVFDHRPQWKAEPRKGPSPRQGATPMSLQRTPVARIVGLALLGVATARLTQGQQTLFNVPSADVLDKGKTLPRDGLAVAAERPRVRCRRADPGRLRVRRQRRGRPQFRRHRARRAGLFQSPFPTSSGSRYKTDSFSLTTGALGLFFLRGSRDGDPAVQLYGHAAAKLPFGTRLTAGGWWASSGYASRTPRLEDSSASSSRSRRI